MSSSQKSAQSRAPELSFHNTHLSGGKLPDFSVGIVKGYGQRGEIALYLPSPRIEKRWKFVDGKPEYEIVGVLNDPETIELRERCLRAIRTVYLPNDDRNFVLFADVHLLIYSANIIKRVYEVTDSDLTYLHSGNRWMESVAIHALGGEDAREVWRNSAGFFHPQFPTTFEPPDVNESPPALDPIADMGQGASSDMISDETTSQDSDFLASD